MAAASLVKWCLILVKPLMIRFIVDSVDCPMAAAEATVTIQEAIKMQVNFIAGVGMGQGNTKLQKLQTI